MIETLWRGPSRLQTRNGYTLTELLVVIIILVILIAVSLPAAKKVMEDSRTRESSRQLSAYFTMARARAAQSGRPCGLWMQLDTPIGATSTSAPYVRQCTQLYLAEVPPPYSGGTLSARGKIKEEPPGSGTFYFVPVDMATPPATDPTEVSYLQALIEDGETFIVRFDYKGDWYRCRRNGSQFTYVGAMTSNVRPWGYNNSDAPGKPYQVLRLPRRVGNPLELTGGTAIDMSYSGMGREGAEFNLAANRIVVMFMPSGAIDGVIGDNNLPVSPTGTIHFLVGKVQKIGDPLNANSTYTYDMFDAEKSNIADPLSLWVSVGRLNGSVTTNENYPDVDHFTSHPNPTTPLGRAEYIEECRQLATGREQMGAK